MPLALLSIAWLTCDCTEISNRPGSVNFLTEPEVRWRSITSFSSQNTASTCLRESCVLLAMCLMRTGLGYEELIGFALKFPLEHDWCLVGVFLMFIISSLSFMFVGSLATYFA